MSSPALAKNWPSGEKQILKTFPEWRENNLKQSPEWTDLKHKNEIFLKIIHLNNYQNLIVLSLDPVAKYAPFGWNATQLTLVVTLIEKVLK